MSRRNNNKTENGARRVQAILNELETSGGDSRRTYSKEEIKAALKEIKSAKKNAVPVSFSPADNQYAQALAAFNPGGTFVPRAAQEEIAARKAANHSRYMDALDTSTRAGVAAAGSGTVRPVMNTAETVALRNEWAKKAAQYEADRQSAGREFRSARGSDEYRDRVGSFDRSTIPYGANNTGRIRYALDDDFRARLDTTNQGLGLLDPTYENLKYLNDFEKNDLANFVAQGDYNRANEYLDHLQPELNARLQRERTSQTVAMAQRDPAAGVIANVTAAKEAGLGVLPVIQGAWHQEMGEYRPVDTNGVAFRAAHMVNDTTMGVGDAAERAARRSAREKALRELPPDATEAEKMAALARAGATRGKIARTLAEAGLSAAQNATLLPMGGTAPLVFMGSMAAGQSALDTLENGGTAQDALKVAAATGIIEAATEKIGIDNFFRISRLGSKGIKDFLKGAKQYKLLANDIGTFSKALGSQMGAEGVEEMIAEVAGNLADTAIRGDNGQYARLVQNYMANGMSEEQAKARAFTDMYIDNVAKAGITGALAGGMLGAGGATIGTYQTSTQNRELIRSFESVGNELQNLNITPEQLISAVQQSGSKDAQVFARELSQKLALGEEVTTAEMGRLHLLSNNYITSKDYEAVQKAAIAEEEAARNAGRNVRESEQNRDAETNSNGLSAENQLRGEESNRQNAENPLRNPAAEVRQNVGNAAGVQQGDVASKATNNTESNVPTANRANEEAPATAAVQTTENVPKEARQPTTYEQGAQVQTPQGEGTVVMTADNTVAVRLANGTTEIFKTADLSSAQANANTALPQSANAQAATGNTVANARANEANTGERSEAAAQPKTVAETSWENIQKIVQTKAKGGLSQKDEYTLNSAGRRTFDRIGRALGVEIHFVDRIVNEEGEANGLYQNGHIFIARNAENPYHVVLAHEITHHFEKTAPDVYEKFKGTALKMNPGLVEKYMAMWGYDEATAEFEVAADFAGELLEKEGTVKRVIKEDISAARGFHRAMNAVFDKVRGDDTKGLTEEEKKLDAQLDAARDMWRRCLRETRDERNEGGESRAQFSLKSVPPVKPTDGQWKRGATFEEVKAAHPTLFELDADESEKRNPTQIKGTVRTYNKIYDLLKAEGFDGTILDASSGLGYGTVSGRENYGFDVDDIEPFADKNYKPRYTDYSALNKKYDVVISNAVLNVLPQDLRDAMVVKIGDLLKPNGRAFVNVRGTDVANASSKVAIDAPSMEYFISTSGSYQKGFTSKELVAYLQDALGDGFAVAPAKGFGAVSAIITKDGKQTAPQMSRKEADKALASAGVAVDEKSESGYALQPQAQMLMQFSRKTFKASDYSPDSPNFKEAVKALARQLGVTQKQAKQFILDVNSVASAIAHDPARLDYVSAEGEGRSAFVSNAEYGGSIDFSTICPKRRMYMGTVEAIQKAMPDKVLSSDDILKIRNMMKDKGYQVACGFCYVEGSRAKLGYYTNQFRKELRDAGEEYVPTQAELMNIESLDRIRREHHDVYKKYLTFMNSLAQRKPKLFQPATEYNGEIIDKFGKDRDKAKVADKNWFGGLRIFSFSDFEAIHMIDMMQVVLDMARVGLAGQAYTKQPDFARVFGGTGIKINLSLVANGVDENGRLTFDGVEGMKIEDAMEIRDMYPDNVGTIVVTFTEAQLKAAMADDRIDFIIPFHRSQWTKKQYGRLGLPADTKDMTYWQNERYFKGKAPTRVNKNGKTVREKAKNFMPNTYWNFKKDGKKNAEAYLKMCAEANKKPKFWNLLVDNKDGSYSLQPDGSTDGYWKLLGDFKMYNHKTGKGVPQKPVKPDFNMTEANRVMREYKGGHESFPVAQDVVDEFVSENGGKTGPRLSRKGQDAAMRRANRLARENARLKGQFKLTKGVKLRESDIRKVTRDLLKEYEIIDFDKDELERHIRAMAEAAQAADESNADKTWDSIRNVARGLSRYVGRAAFARYADADEEYDADLVRETYEDIRRHLGRQRVLSPWFIDPWVENESPQRKEMRDYYRRKLFGVLTLTSDRSVDKGPLGDIGKLYEELTEAFGEAYFPSDVTNDEDQIMHIADVLDDLKDTLTRIGERTPVTVAEDVEQSSRDETRRAAYEDEVYGELYARLEEDILNRIAEVRREKPTFADKKKAEQYAAVERAIEQTQSKAEAAEIANRIEDARKYRERIAKLETRLNKLKAENKGLKGEARQTQKDIREADTYYRQAAQEALREAKAQKREALQELKDKYKAKTAEARERQNARELRKKIEKYTKDLYKTLTKPTNEKHINEDVRPAAALLISLINQESLYTTDYQTGKPVRPGTPPRLTDNGLPAARIANKRTEAARKMRKAAEEIFSGEDNYLLIYDPELMENLAIMEDWSDKPLAAMSSAELQVVWDAVRGVKHMITQSRKVFNEGRQWEIGTLASGLVRDVDLNNPRRTIKYGAAASVDKLLNIDQLTPQAFFHRFGEGGDRLFRMLRRSQDKYVRIIADIQARTAEVIKDLDIDKLNKDIATYKVKGGDVTLSRAQVLLLYASIKREQAAGHILGGGIKAKPLKGKGLFETKQILPVEVTQEDLDNMFKEAKLTEAEKKAADGLVNIMSTVLAEYGNEASLRTYGYAKFREGWYVPIETDPTSNKTDNNDPLFKQFTAAASIAGRGFAKQTKEGAKNAIMVGSLFDVYAKHVNDMAMYAAYVETLENMRRIRNFKFEDGTKTQNYIEALLTKSGVAYWDKLIRDINGGERLKSDDFSFDRFVGAYKAAAVSANIRVILQQPTAIIRAAAEINPAYLIAAMRKIPKRHEWDRVKKNAAIAQWKDWGYFDINTGRQMRDVVLGTDSLFEKFKQAGMRPISGADSFAWTLLYHACEDEAKAKGLRPGSAAFDSFVASRFSDIIDKTQVVDGVLQRSQIMRSTNAVTKMATSFMAEPTKTYNMFLSAVWDFRHARSKTEKQAARKKLGFTVAALVVSFLTNAAAQSLIDALRDDDRDKEFLDKFWDAYLGRPEEDDKNKAVTVMGGNLWTAFNPVTYIPYFKDLASLVQGFDTKRMDMESIGRVIDAAEQALAAARGEGKQTAFARAFALASEVSRVFGLPLANIKRDSVAVLNTIAQEKKDYGMMYNVDRAFYKLDQNKKRFVDIMLRAHDAGDTETENRILDDLHAAGIDDKTIMSTANEIRKKQEDAESVKDLKNRYRTPEEQKKYDAEQKAHADLERYAKGTTAYKQADSKERTAYEKMLKDALNNNKTAQERHEKAQEIGVSDNQYMEFLVAQDVANRQRQDGKDGGAGGVSKNDYIAALEMTSMTRAQKRAAFAQKYPNSKTGNPYA